MAAELLADLSRASDANASPLSGAKWYFYAAGTTTPQSVYTNAALTTAHPNPVVADSGGLFPAIYFNASLSYRGVLKTAAGITVQDMDPINSGILAQLSASGGAALIGTSEGETLESVSGRPRRLKSSTPKPTARTRADVRTMAADYASMVGYADHAGTTGGDGQTEYWVTNSSDDENFEGSLRWAVGSAITNGGGLILFDPDGKFDIQLKRPLIIGASSTNVLNITIDAPGRNVRIRNMPKVEGIRISGQNLIFRRIELTNLAQTYADGEEKDGLGINPLYSDKVWIDECTLGHVSDGVGDCASSALTASAVSTASGFCRISYTHNIIRNQDKCILLGKTGISSGTLSATDYRIFATLHENWFDAAGQRLPLVQQYAFADCVNNVIDFAPFQRQDGSEGTCEGVKARFGGAVHSRGDLFRAMTGTAYAGVSGDADGAYNYTGSVAENAITLASANTSYIPAIPYTLAATEIDASAIIAKCGARILPDPDGVFIFRAGAPDTPDGKTIVPAGNGYFERVDDATEVQPVENPTQPFALPRRITKDIASGAITVEAGDNFFAVETEGEAATDDLVTINGGFDGALIFMRAVNASRVTTIKSTGNINLPSSDIALDHPGKIVGMIYDSGQSKWGVIQ